MGVLSVLLFVIYVIYFRADGGSLQSAVNILRGLNSNTFNYLQTHKDRLNLDTKVPSLGSYNSKISSINFFSKCVKFNKPCKLPELALNWPAVQNWSSENEGLQYLQNLIGENQTVEAYYNDQQIDSSFSFQAGYSFAKKRK